MRAGETVVGIFSEAGADDAIEIAGQRRMNFRDWLGIFLEDGSHHAELRLALECAACCEHFVEYAAEAEDVAARVGFMPLKNFGRQVLKGADHCSMLGQCGGRGAEGREIHSRG